MKALEHFKTVMDVMSKLVSTSNGMVELAEYYTEAIASLEKQEPIKPKGFDSVQENTGTFYYWECPKCGAGWGENHTHLYCTDCGQKFDWSEIGFVEGENNNV